MALKSKFHRTRGKITDMSRIIMRITAYSVSLFRKTTLHGQGQY